ncbi:MAG: cation:proton antiporter, partial [Polyangiaceae bacterium]|nr:cation:proton antiporter [Polyangiaceae bacterium]
GETGTPQGRVSVSILIFQDLAVVPLMLITPWLAGGGGSAEEAAKELALAGLATGVVLAVVSRLFPPALDFVARTRSREIFTIAVVLAALGTAYLTARAGVSLALGAFLAGLVIAGSRYGSEVLAEVLPFKHLFNSLFFISIGMLASTEGVPGSPLLIFGVVVAVVLTKGVILFGVTLAMGFGLRVATVVAFALCQIGEFSFVLAHVGLASGALDGDTFQLLLAVTLVSLAITPFLMRVAMPFADRVGRLPWLRRVFDRLEVERMPPDRHERDHVVVCGYGLNGRSVARVLRRLGVPFVVIELNPALAQAASAEGVPVIYGDASRRVALEHVHVD